MKIKLSKNYKIILIVLSILIIFCITLGVSYALWQITENQTDKNIVSSGCLEITFEEVAGSINLTNAYPISDEEGMKLVPYKFKIKNTCTIDSKYYVTLNSFGDTATAMSDSVIKYAFNLSNKSLASFESEFLINAPINIEITSLDISNLIESYILKEDYLRADEEKEYSLYLWIDYNVGNEIMGQTFQATLSIINVATDQAPLLANLKATASIAATGKFLEGPIVKNTIEKLEFISSNIVPDDVIGFWDVSEQQNGVIMAWYYDSDSNGRYEVYIGEEGNVVANPNSSYLFQNLVYLSSIDLTNLDTSNVTNMSNMFNQTGYSSSVFTLDLGNQFNTSEVRDMQSMFQNTGYNSTVFTLNLGDKFNTVNVTNMSNMFNSTGYNNTVFTLNLGDKFNTSNVTTMGAMFQNTGYKSTVFTLDLGDLFDTSKVTTMIQMFYRIGYNSTVFTLNLGDKFNTSNVTNMQSMFNGTGYSSKVFTLDLGDKFDTSNVTTMYSMFYYTGCSSTIFTLNLGDKFNTIKVTDMYWMFNQTGYSSSVFTLDLGDKFDTSNVTNMQSMFSSAGYKSTVFTLNLGNKFNTSNVTNMSSMFWETGYRSTVFTLDLGDKFDTSKVTNMSSMFSYAGYSSPSFTLNLGKKFNTSKVTSMYIMFLATGVGNSNFILDLRTFNFDNVTSFENACATSNFRYDLNHEVYVKNDSDATWVRNAEFMGQIMDCSWWTCP